MKQLLTRIVVLLSLLSGFSAKCQNHFTDVSEESGINHFFIPLQGTFGGGVAVIDFNGDGSEDLFVAGGAGKNALYKNNGDATFTNIIEQAGFAALDTMVTQGATCADVNKDGYVDIFITTISSASNLDIIRASDQLYINNGDETFTNKTNE